MAPHVAGASYFPARRPCAGVLPGMAIHTLHTKQVIRATPEQAWAFFSNPGNLARITPPELGFEVRTANLPGRIHAGMMIEYRVRVLPGLRVTWLTEITQVREGSFFVDEQRVGPYGLWHHEHWFHPLAGGLMELEDRVTYRLPLQPLGDLAHPLIVRPQLKRIFAFRERAIRELFGSAGG
jgi:ligand-binding SRPBCC domain-containing protein